MDYMGQGKGLKVGELVEGATDRVDAIRRVKEDGERFRRPVVVDWNNGKAGKFLTFLYLSSKVKVDVP